MHHPGPPRFVAAGRDVELAPRDPDPNATYRWQVIDAPDNSAATVGDEPVEHFVPDVSGLYRVELDAPDGTHELTIRAFAGDLAPGGIAGGASGASGQSGGFSGQSGMSGGWSGGRSGLWSGSARSDRDAGEEVSGEGGRPRLSLSTTVTDDAVIVEAHPSAHPNGPETPSDLDVEFLLDDRDDIDEADVTVDDRVLTIPKENLPEITRVHAVAVGEYGYSVPDQAKVVQTDGGIQTELPYHPPEWADDSVIYEIYVRTFAGQEADEDTSAFDAIIDRLDYIADLGVDTVWLTPVLQNDHAPHGYNITDFMSIAEDLGTEEDYKELVAEANDRGLNVLFDLVCNHSARDHPHYQAAVSDPSSEYHDWYEWRGPGEPDTYFDWEYIANFNFDNLEVRRHLLDAVEKWAPLVDGFRIDMAWAVPNGFWKEVHDLVKDIDSDFLLLDETIPYIPDFQGGLFDVHFDSTTYAALRRVGHGDDPADAVIGAIEERARIGFPDHAGFMLYAENHDEARYLVECGEPAARAALGALFTLPGRPLIYAGQEFGQRGKRDDLAWQHMDEDLRAHVDRLADTRTGETALTADAAFEPVDYTVSAGDAEPVVAFAREVDGEAAVVVLNFGTETATVEVGPDTADTDIVTGESVATANGIEVEDVVVLSAGAGVTN